MLFHLALELNTPVYVLEHEMPVSEFYEWCAYLSMKADQDRAARKKAEAKSKGGRGRKGRKGRKGR